MLIVNYISKTLNIREEERGAVFLLLGQTVFLGVFLALFDISTTSLFINTFGESMISKAFLVSGLLGFILSAIYYRLQNIWKFSKLIVVNLLTVSLITFLVRGSFFISDSNALVFMAFVLMGPLNLLGIVGFWGMAGRLFTLRQGKRLFGLIDAGQIFGMILISFLVPVLLSILPSNKDLLFISAVSVFIALIIQMLIVKKFNLNQQDDEKQQTKKIKIPDLYRNRYIRSMTFYVAFSMLAAFFMFYIFLPTTKMQYPGDNEYTVFLGMFTGTLMIFTILIKTFAYEKITKNYGLRVNLILPPALLGLFVILAVAAGLFFGTTPETTSFVLFFLFVALGRLFSVSLKNAIETPSQKILYQSLDRSIRHQVQVAIDGMVNESAAVLAGLLLFIMGTLQVFNVIHYAYLLIGIVAAWIFVAYMVYRQYRASLGATLQTDASNIDEKTLTKKKKLPLEYQTDSDLSLNLKKLKIISKIDPIQLKNYTGSYLNAKPDEAQDALLEEIEDHLLFDNLPDLKNFAKNTSNQNQVDKAQKIIDKFENILAEKGNEQTVKNLVSSAHPEDRYLAAKIITHLKNTALSNYIIILLRDFEPQVRIAAIEAAAHLKEPNSKAVIIDLLMVDEYNLYCFEALKQYGVEAMDQIEQFFYKAGLDQQIQVQIIQLFESIGLKAIPFLLNKLDYTNQLIVNHTLKALDKIGYQPRNESEKQKFLELLKTQISVMTWNMSISINLDSEMHGKELSNAMEAEKETVMEKIYLILELIYNKQSITHVRQNIDQATSESISYAVELLDLFADEEVKPLLFTLFEDVSESEKVKRLQDHFPLTQITKDTLLLDIMNRDINYIARYTKACAIDALKNFAYATSSTTIAHVFNPDILLKQLAALAIAQNDPDKYHEISKRLGKQENVEMETFVNKQNTNTLFSLVTKAKNLAIFQGLPIAEITEIIENSTIKICYPEETIHFKKIGLDILILLEGKVSLKQEKQNRTYNPGDVITQEHLALNTDLELHTLNNAILLYIPFVMAIRFMNNLQAKDELIARII